MTNAKALSPLDRAHAEAKLATAKEALHGAEHWMATIAGRLLLRDQPTEIRAEGYRLAAALEAVRGALAVIEGDRSTEG